MSNIPRRSPVCPKRVRCRTWHLQTSQFPPEVLFDVDRDEPSKHLRSARSLPLDECVVFFRRQVYDAPQAQRLCVRSTDSVFNVKQGLMAAGLKARAVVAHELPPAKKQDLVFPGTQVDLFQNAPVDVCLPGTLLARSQEPFFTVFPCRPVPRIAFANDLGDI